MRFMAAKEGLCSGVPCAIQGNRTWISNQSECLAAIRTAIAFWPALFDAQVGGFRRLRPLLAFGLEMRRKLRGRAADAIGAIEHKA